MARVAALAIDSNASAPEEGCTLTIHADAIRAMTEEPRAICAPALGPSTIDGIAPDSG